MVPSHVNLTVEERIGEAFIVEAAALSTFAPLTLLLYLLYGAVRASMTPPDPSVPHRQRHFRNHLNFYFASLLFSDTIQGLGGFMDLKWVSLGFVHSGPFCTAQGALKQVGDVGVALSILAITLHTFFVLFYRWTPPDSPLLPIVVLSLFWLFILLLTVLGHSIHKHGNPYYGVTGLWCWITADYPVERIALEYGWLWLTAFVNIVIYIPLFFSLRGNLVSNGWGATWQSVGPEAWARPRDQRFHMRMARTMLFYPIIYLISILPTSITRFLSFSGRTVPYQATVFCGLLFSCSGIFNVVLYTQTRPTLLPGSTVTDQETGVEMSMRIVSPMSPRAGSLYMERRKWMPTEVDAEEDSASTVGRAR